jgi:hypothetical protein
MSCYTITSTVRETGKNIENGEREKVASAKSGMKPFTCLSTLFR